MGRGWLATSGFVGACGFVVCVRFAMPKFLWTAWNKELLATPLHDHPPPPPPHTHIPIPSPALRTRMRPSSWLPVDDNCWIDLQSVEKRRRTPLMSAAASGRIQCLKALVEEFGADVNVQVR